MALHNAGSYKDAVNFATPMASILGQSKLLRDVLKRPKPQQQYSSQALPDLGGKTVVVVTENAYSPFQFVDPESGKAVGWEYDAMEELSKRLNFKVDYQNTSWDAMIQAVSYYGPNTTVPT